MSMYYIVVTLKDGRRVRGCLMAYSEAQAVYLCMQAAGVKTVAHVEATRSY